MVRQSTMPSGTTPVRIALTGGGTGGHVSPILAVLEELLRRDASYDAIWIGSKRGIERDASLRQGIPFYSVAVGKLRRYLSLHTIPDATRVPIGVAQSIPILRRFRPDVIFSTGGYVGVPAVVAGRAMKIPAITHEQTAVLGLATRINARFSRSVALSYDSTPHPRTSKGGRVAVTGNPIRSWLRAGETDEAQRIFELEARLPLLYITGGAQGALAINDVVAEALDRLLDVVEIVHQTGPSRFNDSFAKLSGLRERLPACRAARYHPTESVGDELAHLYAAADIVLGRSGAGTVAELAALGKPSILVPLPGAVEQRENARSLETMGAAIVIDQSELTAERLIREVNDLASFESRRRRMSSAALETAGAENAAERLVDEILSLANQNRWNV